MAKQQPERRFTLLYDKVCRQDILQEAWQRVKSNKGAAGVDEVAIDEIREYGEARFLGEIAQELRDGSYRVSLVRRVHIPKPGQPGKTRPLGIPTVKDRVIQMAVKLVIEPLFEADFVPCSFGFRPEKTPRMALSIIAEKTQAGYSHVVDVDLKSYFDTISHELLLELVERRVGDVKVVRLIRAWLKAGVMEEGKVTHPDRGSPQGGVISPLLSNIMLHEVDRQWCRGDGTDEQFGRAGTLRGRYGAAGAHGIRGQASVGATPKPVCGSTIGGEPGEEPADYGGGGLCVSWLRVSEPPETVAVYVAAQEGVPTYPGSDARSSPIVSQ
jgi:RNA-directed DNA polymerase